MHTGIRVDLRPRGDDGHLHRNRRRRQHVAGDDVQGHREVDLKGFYQPVDMSTGSTIVWSTVKNGSTVPLKFEVFAGATELTTTSTINQPLKAVGVSCGTTSFTDEIELVATGGTVLRYDTTGGQFIYNWQTPKKSGACYKVTVETADGSSISAFFLLK